MPHPFRPPLFTVAILCALTASLVAAPPPAASALRVTDTFRPDPDEPSAAARKMLHDLAWPVETFDVALTAPARYPHSHVPNFTTDADALVTFPSPRPAITTGGPSPIDTVVLEWFKAKPAAGSARPDVPAPAVLVLHIMDDRLVVDRGIARSLAARGIHAFLMHLPDYGLRFDPDRSEGGGARFLQRLHQGVADARRARDVIAAMTGVDPRRISLDGTSLGGFVGAVTASLDRSFDNAFIMLAGGDLYTVFTKGTREAALVRAALQNAGYTGEKLRQLTASIDPLVLAHRLRPQHTWLFSARADEVVPESCARALAAAAGLDPSHHIWVSGDHYSSLLSLPWAVGRIAATIQAEPAPAASR